MNLMVTTTIDEEVRTSQISVSEETTKCEYSDGKKHGRFMCFSAQECPGKYEECYLYNMFKISEELLDDYALHVLLV